MIQFIFNGNFSLSTLHGTRIKLKFGQWRLNPSWSCLNVYYRPGDVSTYNCYFTKLFHISTYSMVNKLLSSFHTLEFVSIEFTWSLLQSRYMSHTVWASWIKPILAIVFFHWNLEVIQMFQSQIFSIKSK